MVTRTQHFMNGFYMEDGSFINVIYQKNLDVLDVPFQIQKNVRIPVGTYKFDELTLTYNTNPARRLYERFSYNPMEFYGGTKQTISAPSACAAAATCRASCSSAGTTCGCRGATSWRTWQSCASTTPCRRGRPSAA